MASALFNIVSFSSSFHGLHQRCNPPYPKPLSLGLASPEADLCGESSRHHMLVLCPYEPYLLEQLGLWHQIWRTQQNKDLTKTRCNTVLPDHPLCFVLDLPQIVMLPVGGDACLFVREGQSQKKSPKNHKYVLSVSAMVQTEHLAFCFCRCDFQLWFQNYSWLIING